MRLPLPAASLAALTLVLALGGCIGEDLAGQVAGNVPFLGDLVPGAAPAPRFAPEVLVDGDLGGAEPSVIVDPHGRIFVAAPTGLGSGLTSGDPSAFRGSGAFWRSLDGGASFELIDPIVLGLYGPSIGGGDSDIVSDAEGNLYAIDLWLGNVGFLASRDHGETWLQGNPAIFALPGTDRQWIDVDLSTGALYVVTNHLATGLWVAHSGDGGLTWLPQTPAVTWQERSCICPPGMLAVDETTGNVYLPYALGLTGGVGLATSTDGGLTFTTQVIETLAGADGHFPVLVHDTAGNLYLLSERDDRILLTTSQDQGLSWSEARVVHDIPSGAQIFPWAVAGSAGRLAVAWYEQTDDAHGAAPLWDVRLALTTDALAETGPAFGVARLNTEPVLRGAYSREALADFFEIAMGPDGSVHAVWNAAPEGSDRQVIMYARQSGGPGLLEGVGLEPAQAARTPGHQAAVATTR